MEIKYKIDIAYKIIKAKLLKDRCPLVVGWSITNRCNLSCIYCGKRNNNDIRELKTIEIFSIIDELKSLGTKMISFTGGEPLLRSDIKEIIDYTHKSGIKVNINTNGVLFQDKISELDNLDSVKFSLDGPQGINDYMRGQGTFQKVAESIKIATKKGILTSIVTVLTKYNLDSIDYLINLAEKLDINILFQPSTKTLLGTGIANPHIPQAQEYKKTIDRLIEYKKKNKPVFNTIKGLLHLRNWPDGSNIFCHSINIACRIETDGYLYHCGRHQNRDYALNCLTDGVKKSFSHLTPISCNDCWCALSIEANYIASLDLAVILSHYLTSRER